MGYKLIINVLSKIILRGIIIGEKGWISHLSVILMAEKTIIKVSTGMISFHILYGYDAVLSIKLDILI